VHKGTDYKYLVYPSNLKLISCKGSLFMGVLTMYFETYVLGGHYMAFLDLDVITHNDSVESDLIRIYYKPNPDRIRIRIHNTAICAVIKIFQKIDSFYQQIKFSHQCAIKLTTRS
jgi:hypothetical protein